MNFVVPYKSCYVFGAVRYFAALKNTVCLIHGPTGCAFFHLSSVHILNHQYHSKKIPPRIFTTDFSENDAIFGGTKKLMKAVIEIDEKYQPELIVVFNCCVTEVIGEDIEGAVDSIKDQINAEVVALKGAGFKGEQRKGMREACKIIYKKFMNVYDKNVEKNPDTINFIGELRPSYSSVDELIKLLKMVNIKTNLIIPVGCEISCLKDAAKASLNYLVCGTAAKYLVEKLKEDYGVPYIGGKANFIGLENSKETLEKIFSFFNRPNTFIEKQYQFALAQTKDRKDIFKGKKAVIVCGTRRSLGYSRLLSELGFSVELVFMEGEEKPITKEELKKYSSNVLCDEHSEEVQDYVLKNKTDIILSTISDIVLPGTVTPIPDRDFFGFAGFIYAYHYFKEELSKNSNLVIKAN